MTSLNPLHTIEQQIGEILLLHRGMTGEPARARILELLTQVGIPNPETPAEELSAPDVRRPAPARDDRDGARQRAGPADRRRADDRAGRHRAGANPQASQGFAGPARHGHAVHHPRPRHRPQDRRPGLRDEGRQDRRGKRRRRHLQVAAASLHPGAARGRAASACAAAQSDRRHRAEDRQPEGLVSDQARRHAQDCRPHQGGRRRQRRGAQGRDARRGRRIRARARPRWAWRCCG